jgi:chaperonin cofactor prefoldin
MNMNELEIELLEQRLWELETANGLLRDRCESLSKQLDDIQQQHRGCEARIERLRSGLFELDNV